MMLRLLSGAGLAAFLLASAASAAACEGSKVLFEDDFAEYQSTWGSPNNERAVKDGKMVLTPDAEFTAWATNSAGIYDDIDFCADVTSVKAVDPSNSYAGLMFWHVDNDNFYMFVFDADGNATVKRLQKGRWLTQVGWDKADGVKTGDGATNTVRVVTRGNVATYYINGKQFAEGKGAPPGAGQLVGVVASSPKKGRATFTFTQLKVTEPD